VSFGLWHTLGRVPYAAALALQDRVAAERERGLRPDTLLLLEHPPTITLGRRATAADVLWDEARLRQRGISVVRVGRGGRATVHGPGQLVGYPIVRLSRGGRGVRHFVCALEGMLLDVAASFGVSAERRAGHPGIWVGDRKLASIGIEVRRGVSRHGFALNVDTDLEPFSAIVPCGVPGLRFVDLSRAAGAEVQMTAVIGEVVRAWRARFGEIEEEMAHDVEVGG